MLAEMGVPVWWPERRAVPDAAGAAPEPGAPAGVSDPHRTAAARDARPTPPAQAAADRLQPVPPATPVSATLDEPAGADRAAELPASAVDTLDWTGLEAAVAGCQACGLCRSRRQTVFGTGDRDARWMVIGEAPGEKEDLQGEPFVGPAGRLLDNMLRAIGVSRQDTGDAGVYVANVLKCRPPANRNPQPEEVVRCEPYLRRQVALVRPRLILAMGRFAVQSLLRTQEPIGRLRGRIHSYEGVPVIVTYHPAYLLRNLPEKARAWADLCLAREQFDRAD